MTDLSADEIDLEKRLKRTLMFCIPISICNVILSSIALTKNRDMKLGKIFVLVLSGLSFLIFLTTLPFKKRYGDLNRDNPPRLNVCIQYVLSIFFVGIASILLVFIASETVQKDALYWTMIILPLIFILIMSVSTIGVRNTWKLFKGIVGNDSGSAYIG